MPTRSIRPLIATVLALAAIKAAAGTPPPTEPVPFDGRYYEVVISSKISWDDAKAAAESRSYKGVQGHLATIGSAEEDAFIDNLRLISMSWDLELWVGGYQEPCATGTPEPGCGWLWINGEPISPTNTDSPYTNWQAGQPNNLARAPDDFNDADEDHLAVGFNAQPGWNDEGSRLNVVGYVVEYGDKVVVPATTCADSGGCNLSGGQVQLYPETAEVQDDATLTARTYRIQDDPARCGVSPLTLFDGAVVLPPYLCGHPDFLVIETHTAGVEILSGAIDVENLTEDVLPDNLYGCTNVRQNPSGEIDPDPSHRDVVAWQSQDPAQMLETSHGTGRYLGTVAEVTYGCGSSRGKVVNGSFHFVGLRIHPGLCNELADGNPTGNHQSFIDLTRYKLELLSESVLDSKAGLSKKDFAKLKGYVDSAIQLHDRRKYKEALAKISAFVDAVELTSYQAIAGQNFNGDHIMRGSNIEFMYAQKVVPFETGGRPGR